MELKTADSQSIKSFLQNLHISPPDSHKGMNGRILIIGGSTLFHAASLWAAEVASQFVDMLHYSSTTENSEIFVKLKSQFRNGIIVQRKDLPSYVEEDDAILIGPGMVRDDRPTQDPVINSFEDILKIQDEVEYTRSITYYLLHTYPDKRFVIDAGALQMMNPEWLLTLKQPPIITPHQGEFERLFEENVTELSLDQKKEKVKQYAKKYKCVILLKAITDIISDGNEVYTVDGGNAGLTKGGSGDILAGLTVSLFSKNESVQSAILASFIVKSAADKLSEHQGNWYNMAALLSSIPVVLYNLYKEAA
jgi:NAD(P)H-hydrate epimerase